MANRAQVHPLDKGGEWFADKTCIQCDVARLVAPGLIAEDDGGRSYFTRPPSSPEEERMAWRALLACPSASIGAPKGEHPPEDAFPWEVAPGAWMLGYNSAESFGATAWFVPRAEGNLMIDAPRWSQRVADAIEARGGLAHVLLTHRDDVADYAKYARRFGARVWIHEEERAAARDASDVFDDDVQVAPGVRAIAVPGHTRGSTVFLVDDRLLFTGDSFEWNRETQDLEAFEDYTWYSWAALAESLARLAREARFEWVLPGHGGWGRSSPNRLLALSERMRR